MALNVDLLETPSSVLNHLTFSTDLVNRNRPLVGAVPLLGTSHRASEISSFTESVLGRSRVPGVRFSRTLALGSFEKPQWESEGADMSFRVPVLPGAKPIEDWPEFRPEHMSWPTPSQRDKVDRLGYDLETKALEFDLAARRERFASSDQERAELTALVRRLRFEQAALQRDWLALRTELDQRPAQVVVKVEPADVRTGRVQALAHPPVSIVFDAAIRAAFPGGRRDQPELIEAGPGSRSKPSREASQEASVREFVQKTNRNVWTANLGLASHLSGVAAAANAPMPTSASVAHRTMMSTFNPVAGGSGWQPNGPFGQALQFNAPVQTFVGPRPTLVEGGVPVWGKSDGGSRVVIEGTRYIQPSMPTSLPAASKAFRPTRITPEHGLVTIVAPPVQVASPEMESKGSAVRMNWASVTGAGKTLDESGFRALGSVLPVGANVLYPALPRGALPAGGVNVPVTPRVLQQLVKLGYGTPVSSATAEAVTGSGASYVAAPTKAFKAEIVPIARPMGVAGSVLGSDTEGATQEAGASQGTRGGVLDFLGAPVRLAPSLASDRDLSQQVAAQAAVKSVVGGRPLRPQQFGVVRQHLLGAAPTIQAEPNQVEWQKAAPSFGLRDTKPSTLFSVDARVQPAAPSFALPQSDGGSLNLRQLASPTGIGGASTSGLSAGADSIIKNSPSGLGALPIKTGRTFGGQVFPPVAGHQPSQAQPNTFFGHSVGQPSLASPKGPSYAVSKNESPFIVPSLATGDEPSGVTAPSGSKVRESRVHPVAPNSLRSSQSSVEQITPSATSSPRMTQLRAHTVTPPSVPELGDKTVGGSIDAKGVALPHPPVPVVHRHRRKAAHSRFVPMSVASNVDAQELPMFRAPQSPLGLGDSVGEESPGGQQAPPAFVVPKRLSRHRSLPAHVNPRLHVPAPVEVPEIQDAWQMPELPTHQIRPFGISSRPMPSAPSRISSWLPRPSEPSVDNWPVDLPKESGPTPIGQGTIRPSFTRAFQPLGQPTSPGGRTGVGASVHFELPAPSSRLSRPPVDYVPSGQTVLPRPTLRSDFRALPRSLADLVNGTRIVPSGLPSAPAMLLSTPPPSQTTIRGGGSVAIQRQVGGHVSSGTSGAGARASTHIETKTEADKDASADINVLAGEVWSVLKRRIEFEAERRGRR